MKNIIIKTLIIFLLLGGLIKSTNADEMEPSDSHQFNFFSGFGFSMGGNTMTVSRVVNLVSHLRHIRNLVLPLGKSLGFVGTTFSSVDLQFGQVSMI